MRDSLNTISFFAFRDCLSVLVHLMAGRLSDVFWVTSSREQPLMKSSRASS